MEKLLPPTLPLYPEYDSLNLPEVDRSVLSWWESHSVFEKSLSSRAGKPRFTFYEGPPSANGLPGIHHVMSRAIKDIFCRYKTLRGFQVHRKGGWDTHGLPIELQVEKKLGITREDIGRKISVDAYNQECRKDVLAFKDKWEECTRIMGYWVDLDNPYITFENNYIESVWNILKRLFDRNLLYKGFTIQPFSPAAGTGLSSHELNLPGTYKEVKDTTIVAQFKLIRNEKASFLFDAPEEEVFFLAWTTTPWTLPANTALAVGKSILYSKVKTTNPYTGLPISVLIASDLLHSVFTPEGTAEKISDLPSGKAKIGGKVIEYQVVKEVRGLKLTGLHFEQLLPYIQPDQPAFRVIPGDFVTTSEGTGIVHISPTFGADDFRVAAQNGIPGLWVRNEEDKLTPIVDRTGKFVPEMGEFAGRYVKNYKDDPDWKNPDIDIAIKLKTENRAFRVEKYEHTYPHCWRTDKPVLYYPLDSWFIRTTAAKDRMAELNRSINWKPAATGTGRFGHWLENLVDWNLSRSRYWGVPLPVWCSEDMSEKICIGSIAELRSETEKAVRAGWMNQNILDDWDKNLDLHKPFVDDLILVSPAGAKMTRQSDLIDVWFDSGAMPYAQWHYPFENEKEFRNTFPADFIAEGVDQTRGWFFTLHAIAVMLEDSVAYRNVIANGLVLDKNGEKMSKRKGNVVDPFEVIGKYGADATRWYMIANAPPWENLKFSFEYRDSAGKSHDHRIEGQNLELVCPGIEDVQRRFFGTLFNTCGFYALYANIDRFDFREKPIPLAEREEIDRWILSELNSLVRFVSSAMDDYDPTKAIQRIEFFVVDHLSNWYIRLSRRRFWKGEMNRDKIAAYQTLRECLLHLSVLISPFAPFYGERLYRDLCGFSGDEGDSVHLSEWPAANDLAIDTDLEERMSLAQQISSLGHSIRKRKDVSIRLRQPLSKILVPATDEKMRQQLQKVSDLIRNETNVKKMELIGEESGILVRKVKPDFRVLGPKAGKYMKEIGQAVASFGAEEIRKLEESGFVEIELSDRTWKLERSELEIISEDIPGWSVASNGKVTVALDVTLTPELVLEGTAREFVNRIQNIRKESGFEVTDRVKIRVSANPGWDESLKRFLPYICSETLADSLEIVPGMEQGTQIQINDARGSIIIKR